MMNSFRRIAPFQLFFIVFMLVTSVAFAQTVTGKVSDEEKAPVAKATVLVKGTSRQVTTDDAGRFTINASGRDVLVFTSVGFLKQEIPVNNNRTLDVAMVHDVKMIDDVVVTALGIKRASRTLGYAASTVNVNETQQNRTTNVMASLEGKIAGLDISPPSAGAGASTKVRLRGQSSFAGANNSPLIVVNGLPMNQNASGADGGNSRDNGDNFLLFNPDDIESMTVLKGATAAAIYGTRAANGAIIITTKSGNKNAGIGVEVTSSFNADEALDLTNYQREFGQGANGIRPANAGLALNSGQFGWGERYDGVPTPQFDGVSRPYSPQPSYIKDFFDLGKSFNNTVAFSGGNAKGSFRVSYSNNDAKGITPANEYHRKIVNLGINQNLTDKLSVQVNLNYSNVKNLNPPQIGVQGQNYMNFLVRMSPTVPLDVFKEKAVNADGAETPTNGFGTTLLNPYFYIPRQYYKNYEDRILGTATLRYQFAKWLYLQGRVNMDYSRSLNEQNNPTGGAGYGTANSGIYYNNTRTTYNGSYGISETSGKEMNYEFLLGGNQKFGDFSIDAFFGGNRRTVDSRSVNAGSEAFIAKDVYSIGNGSVFSQGAGYSTIQQNSLFGSAELGYKNLVYLTGTARNDWFSTLNPKKNSYLYPSLSLSFVFSELFKEKMIWLDYGKVRAAVAEVASASGPGFGAYSGNLTYGFNTLQYLGRTIGNINGDVSPNPNITPFPTFEKEIGLELKMFKSRLNVDISAYHKQTSDQIMSSQISATSGYNTTLINVGALQNKGIEFMLDVVPVRTKNFTWNSTFNTAYNTSKVLSMGGVQRFTVVDWYNGGNSNEFMGKQVYEVGKPMAQIAAKTYLRNANGDILVNSAGGLVPTQQDVLFGSALPTFVGGWNNTVRFHKLSLLVHFDYKAGGKMLSGSALNSLRQGHSQASLVGRRPGENGITFPGVYNVGTPNAGKPNTSVVYGQQFYADYRTQQIADPFIYKSDYVKLRNVTLSYDFTSLVNAGFIKGLTLAASCRNVAILKKFVPDIDPEAVASSGDNRAGYEAVSLPTTRSYGLNLSVKF